MMMKNLSTTAECLRDLVAFHAERINGYENMRNKFSPEETCLESLFTGFIRQSKMMKKELYDIGTSMGIKEEMLLPQQEGEYGLAWSVVKAVFSDRMPSYSLDKCKSGENALLIAYHSVEGTDGLNAEVRALVNKQKREVIAARDWIAHFERLLHKQAMKEPLAAVS